MRAGPQADETTLAARGTKDSRPGVDEKGTDNRLFADASDPKKKRSHPAPSLPQPAVLFVGKLSGLTPNSLIVSKEKNGPGASRSTAGIDFRLVSGFESAARAAIVRLGFPQAKDAEVRRVNNREEYLAGLKRVGARQSIYLGHALGMAGLEPGGLDTPTVIDDDLKKAIVAGAPEPIVIGCFGAETRDRGTRRGLRAFLRWKHTEADVRPAGMKKTATLDASDIAIQSIELTVEGKPFAPTAPLREHVPRGPE